MAEKKDYYEILGVSKDATEEDIKKAYRTAAMKWHPDRWANGSDEEKKRAEEKFKELSEANEILSNPQKRQMYDNGGTDFDMGGFDPMEAFRRAAESMGGFGFDMGGFNFMGGGRHNTNRGSTVYAETTITLKEAYEGVDKIVSITREKPCGHCNGTGSEDGKETTCPHCGGKGMIAHRQQIGPNQITIMTTQCPHCHGTGKIIEHKCTHCGGTGIEAETTQEVIGIIKGISDGMTMRIPNKGNAPKNGNGQNGNLELTVHVLNDPYFERPDEINLIHYEELPFNEVLLGFKRQFKCIDGSTVTVDAPELTKHGQAFIFRGKGMPDVNGRGYGDYAVIINYKLPSKLTDKQRKALETFNLEDWQYDI